MLAIIPHMYADISSETSLDWALHPRPILLFYTPLGAGEIKFKPTFILTYRPSGPNLPKWLREAFPILKSDNKLKVIYPTPP